MLKDIVNLVFEELNSQINKAGVKEEDLNAFCFFLSHVFGGHGNPCSGNKKGYFL